MKYAREVIELLGAFPGREFRMAQIVNYVARGRTLKPSERNAVRIGVFRVLEQLRESGQVEQNKDSDTRATYSWIPPELLHAMGANCHAKCNNIGRDLAP